MSLVQGPAPVVGRSPGQRIPFSFFRSTRPEGQRR